MKHMEINFSVSGWVKQEIVLNDDCPLSQDEVFPLMEQGKILTTIQEGGNVLWLHDGKFDVIGTVVSVENDGEYFDFEYESCWEEN